jgi:hypothetical protein
MTAGCGAAGEAADVTPERLANPERGKWLMNHRTYDGQRFSPLARINRDTVKALKLAYAVGIGGTSANENVEATPLAEDQLLPQEHRDAVRPADDSLPVVAVGQEVLGAKGGLQALV